MSGGIQERKIRKRGENLEGCLSFGENSRRRRQ
jgi:hypothetical protein